MKKGSLTVNLLISSIIIMILVVIYITFNLRFSDQVNQGNTAIDAAGGVFAEYCEILDKPGARIIENLETIHTNMQKTQGQAQRNEKRKLKLSFTEWKECFPETAFPTKNIELVKLIYRDGIEEFEVPSEMLEDAKEKYSEHI